MNKFNNRILGMRPADISALVERQKLLAAGNTPVAIEKPETIIVEDIAIIPVKGMITRETEDFTTSNPFWVADEIKKAMADAQVTKIILDVDSPGGDVPTGIISLCDLITASRKEKPIYAVTDGEIYSAAYWICAAATKVISTKDAETGGIGIYVATKDLSKQLEQQGVAVEVISSGVYKAAGIQGTPLTDKQREQITARVAFLYEQFVETVEGNRKIKKEYLQGQSYYGLQALELGFVDRLVPDFNSAVAWVSEAG